MKVTLKCVKIARLSGLEGEKMMTYDDFMRTMLTAWPNAIIGEGPLGELVVHTGYGVREVEGIEMVVELEIEEVL
jgi:hypothetical protein